MSFRRKNSTRRPSGSETGQGSLDSEEQIENPNAYGLFGQYQAPPAIYEEEANYELQAQQSRPGEHLSAGGYPGHHHQQQQHPGWQPVGLTRNPSQSGLGSRQQGQGQETFHAPQNSISEQGHEHQQQGYFGQAPSEGHAPLVDNHNVAYAYRPASGQAAPSPHLTDSPGLSRKGTMQIPSANASDFDLVHSAKGGHLEKYGAELPIRLGHLFKRPLIRQWVLQNRLYREVDDREPSQFELFFDLVMVGIIHKLADGAAEAATGLNVAKFILVFYPAWSIWTDVRSYINVSGTDDVWQRIYILIVMILLAGYAANATGIIIEEEESDPIAGHGEVAPLDEEEGHATTEAGAHARRTVLTAVTSAGAYLVKRSGSSMKEDIKPTLVREIGHTGFWFASGWHGAIASAIGFYLVAKFCRLFLYFVYGLLLPKFRKALWLNMISLILISLVYLPIMFIKEPGWIVILVVAGVLLELSSRYMVAAVMQKLHGAAKHKGHKTYIPAYSLPHMMERMTQFTILVVGESIMNATYIAFSGEFGPQKMFWRASLSIVIAFMIMWLYFDNDSSRTFVHGLKRHWFTSITFTHLHFPLCAGLILMSSALVNLIVEEAVEKAYLWFFSGSIALALLCIGLLGTLHKSLDKWGSSAIPKSARISVRFILAAIFGVMPLLHHWKSVEFLGAHAALLTMAVAFETFGKLGSYGRYFDPARTEDLRRRRREADEGGLHYNTDTRNIPLSQMSPSAREKKHNRRLSHAAGEIIETATRKLHKDGTVKGPGRRASWHEYDDLTPAERGEDDVGVESQLGQLETKEVSSGERWAYVAT